MEKPSVKAPGLKLRPRNGRWAAYWMPSAEAVRRGYPSGSVPLSHLVDEPALLIDLCHRHQNDMLAWLDGLRRDPLAFDGTIRTVLRIYETHGESPFHALKPGGRKPYQVYLRCLAREIGTVRVDHATALDVKRWHAEWSKGGTKRAAGHMRLAVLKAALTFCVVAGHRICRTLRDDIRELRLPAPRKRKLVATVEQIRAAIASAHDLGRPSLAICYAMQFETALRQWDAAGQWFPLDDPLMSTVHDGTAKWAGLEWRHVGADGVLRYTPSKTEDTSAAEIMIDLAFCPLVLTEIARVPAEQRVGPIVVNEKTGRPYTQDQFCRAWAKVRTAAGIPRELWTRDFRASAVTEGRGGGALIEDAAKVAGHTKTRTTSEVYDRDRLEAHRRFAKARLDRRAAPKGAA